jgi:hypothetical protein
MFMELCLAWMMDNKAPYPIKGNKPDFQESLVKKYLPTLLDICLKSTEVYFGTIEELLNLAE